MQELQGLQCEILGCSVKKARGSEDLNFAPNRHPYQVKAPAKFFQKTQWSHITHTHSSSANILQFAIFVTKNATFTSKNAIIIYLIFN